MKMKYGYKITNYNLLHETKMWLHTHIMWQVCYTSYMVYSVDEVLCMHCKCTVHALLKGKYKTYNFRGIVGSEMRGGGEIAQLVRAQGW